MDSHGTGVGKGPFGGAGRYWELLAGFGGGKLLVKTEVLVNFGGLGRGDSSRQTQAGISGILRGPVSLTGFLLGLWISGGISD